MYCPSCGSEERQLSRFCRACGTDLRVVRTTLERPDAITASAVSAREQIGMAVADMIRDLRSGKDLEHVAEDVLPHFEKFLESPEEKRLRRIRRGVITTLLGLGWTIVFFLMAMDKSDFLPGTIPGFLTFLVGLGIVINGLLFTVPRKKLPGGSQDALSQQILDATTQNDAPHLRAMTSELPPQRTPVASITEHTTHHLNTKKS
jgi:hypothetical protein